MRSRDTSPPALSDEADSAISSLASSNGKPDDTLKQLSSQSRSQPKQPQQYCEPKTNTTLVTPQIERLTITKQELVTVSTKMRYNNTALISRSIRTHLFCFDDLDTQRFDTSSNHLLNFISIGVNKCASSIQRPVSILWPTKYDEMVEQLADLDAYLINTEYMEKPIQWMLQTKLTTIPKCHICQAEMNLVEQNDTVQWQCKRTPICFNTYTPLQRPNFFRLYEHIGLIKIFFSIYFWATSTQFEFVNKRLSLERQTLHGIWKCIQNVCRIALEKNNFNFQLSTNHDSNCDPSLLSENPQQQQQSRPIDLISITLNGNYVVCAKQPDSNRVRLGLIIPGISTYTFTELTKPWFAPNSHIRVCEAKFMALARERNDLRVDMVSRAQMMSKMGAFDRESAFGYLICQLTLTFKDFDISTLKREDLKLILAEMQWREYFGTTPMEAFCNIIHHISKYEPYSECYLEPRLSDKKELIDTIESDIPLNLSDFIYAEKYFYANFEPIDSKGNIIRRFSRPDSLELMPRPVARFFCHLCNQSYESFYFSMHMIDHVETIRRENLAKQIVKNKPIECKHCFKPHNREDIVTHSNLLRTHLHTISHGCRICCIKFKDRQSFLEHMRRTHYQHETPYRCPCCRFATSFQREVLIHFQEEHRNSFIIMCPFCLRSFTIGNPKEFTADLMERVSILVYKHFLRHYVLANSYNCNNCCLSFLSQDKLQKHQACHHNPLEAHPESLVKFQQFIISPEEEPYCVKAMPSEVFIANKRPNIMTDESHQRNGTKPRRHSSRSEMDSDVSTSDSDVTNNTANNTSSSSSSDDSDDDNQNDIMADDRDKFVHVRKSKPARKFLYGGKANLRIITKPGAKLPKENHLSSERLIECMSSSFNRADGVIANQSVILTSAGLPVRCVECMEYITVDHYVAVISCKQCKYSSHCPRAATKHQTSRHNKID